MKKTRYDVGNNERLDEALGVIYADAMMSVMVQRFAKKHPGVEMRMRAAVTVELVDKPSCTVTGRYPGYIVKSD
jgi:hypothetical protein